MHAQGIDVQFFTNLDSFLKELDVRRAGIIIVSDHEEPLATEKVLKTLMNTPEIQGAKMIYICSAANLDLRMFAAGLGFRDIIPDDLEDRQWLQRVRFASAGRPVDFRQPAVQTTMHQISNISLPGRVVWISPTLIRVECKAKPPTGATFNLSGPLADALGVSALKLTVQSSEKTNLLYRFSDALICRWSIPASSTERSAKVLNAVQSEDPGPRCRIFVAVKNSSLRREILSTFDDPRFEIATALQKNSIANDPRFFCPDMVLIESTLCSLENDQFTSMMMHLPEHTAVIIFGKVEKFSEIKAAYAPRTVLTTTTVPSDIVASTIKRFMPIRKKLEGMTELTASHLSTENPLSVAEVSFNANLIRIHPNAISLSLPFSVSNFALARIDCPYIRKSVGRNLMIKVTNVFRSMINSEMNHSYQIEGYLADTSVEEQRRLADSIFESQIESLKSFKSPDAERHEVSFYKIPVALPPPPKRPVQAIATVFATEAVAAMPENATMGKASGETYTAGIAPTNRPIPAPAKEFVKMAQRFAEPAIDLEDEGRFILRDEIAPMWEAAGDIRGDFVQGIRDGVQSDIFKSIVAIFLTILGLLTVLWVVANHIAPAWEKSGSQYSDRLKEFAPHLQQKQQENPESDPEN